MSDAELADVIATNLRDLRSNLSHCPKLPPTSTQDVDVIELIACAGWTFGGLVDAPAGASPASCATMTNTDAISCTEKKLEVLQCTFCLRAVAVQSFSHSSVSSASVDGSLVEAAEEIDEGSAPPAKKRRCDESRPWRGIWTPTHRTYGLSATDNELDAVAFDPQGLHRCYCPMYSRLGNELSPTATRIVRCLQTMRRSSEIDVEAIGVSGVTAKEVDARAAATMVSTSDDCGTVAEDLAESSARSAEAIAHAEKLVQTLSELLPRQ